MLGSKPIRMTWEIDVSLCAITPPSCIYDSQVGERHGITHSGQETEFAAQGSCFHPIKLTSSDTSVLRLSSSPYFPLEIGPVNYVFSAEQCEAYFDLREDEEVRSESDQAPFSSCSLFLIQTGRYLKAFCSLLSLLIL